MDIAAATEQIPDYPLDVSMTALADMAKILSALGNEDALAIFLLARNGIVSSKDAIQSLGLTQKRFYTRLKELIDNKLIEKSEGAYRLTALGEILCNIGLSMEKLLVDKDKLKIMSQLSKVKSLSEKQKNELMEFFSIDIFSQSKGIKIVNSFDELVAITVQNIDNAKNSLYLATQYIDNRVINAGLRALERGIVGRIMVSKIDQFNNAMKILLSLVSNPKQIATIYKFLQLPEIQIRCVTLPYTFIIIDEERCIIEIKDILTDTYKYALFIPDEYTSKKMLEVFNSFWESGEDLKNKIHI